jgi:hypothetical protein
MPLPEEVMVHIQELREVLREQAVCPQHQVEQVQVELVTVVEMVAEEVVEL